MRYYSRRPCAIQCRCCRFLSLNKKEEADPSGKRKVKKRVAEPLGDHKNMKRRKRESFAVRDDFLCGWRRNRDDSKGSMTMDQEEMETGTHYTPKLSQFKLTDLLWALSCRRNKLGTGPWFVKRRAGWRPVGRLTRLLVPPAPQKLKNLNKSRPIQLTTN